MKCQRVIMVFILFLCVAVTGIPCKAAPTIGISNRSYVLMVGEKQQLKVEGKGVKWSSSAKTVASVSQKGVVTAKKTGETTITAKTGDSVYKCKVKVTKARKAPVYSLGTGPAEQKEPESKDAESKDVESKDAELKDAKPNDANSKEAGTENTDADKKNSPASKKAN